MLMTFGMDDLDVGTNNGCIKFIGNEVKTFSETRNRGIPKTRIKLSMLVYTFNPITQKAEEGEYGSEASLVSIASFKLTKTT